ncbi:hypothetical protein [Acuticoccus sp. I52.16.1]|uniref:hypothetical protein n=1 Tax=Acuticoccus sp. I52.16.1 TaxID=2928472 RepID=UPI001FD27DF6|nr:hypothetical protein [Acuticoccus sp. I52.16.1]UOM36711.1 hypothetical protein MRB58_11195 [Acuticoccus sp. I52.16.1]
MTNAIQKHLWADLGNAPAASGIYAWYYSPEITDFDLERTIEAVQSATERSEAERVIRAVLDGRLFHYFEEEPYTAAISGPLKPAYVGSLAHETAASASLVSRLASEPERLRTIRDALTLSAPMFSSPLYIGMASVLRSRLARHKELIERFRSIVPRDGHTSQSSDAGFAWQVAKRKIPPERLLVFTCLISSDDGAAVDIENILNRICYPILGRN